MTLSTPVSAIELRRAARFVCHMAVLSGRYRRNSIEAIRECVDAGVERLEIDVHSLDGPDYVIFHDRRLEDHTTGSGSIGHATPADIHDVRFREHPDERPPLLSEVIDLVRESDTELQLDLKDWRPLSDARLRTLINVIAPARDRCVISTGQDWTLRRIHGADPAVRFGFDPGHYIDHVTEGTTMFLPRTMGAYDYRDDHPLAFGRTEAPTDYLRERFEMLALQAPGASEYFLSYRLVLQMVDDGFNVAEYLHKRGIDANVWTPDYHGPESLDLLERLAGAGFDRITTNTAPAWVSAFAAHRS